MQKPAKMAIIMMVATIFFLVLCGCHGSRVTIGSHPTYEAKSQGPPPWAPAHGYRAKHRYHYYPSSSIYFDVGRGLYFYYEGGDWRVSASLPVAIHIDINEYVTLEMDTDRPYEFHSDVTKRYPPGQLKKMGKAKGKRKW
jgi:hypothetical protein